MEIIDVLSADDVMTDVKASCKKVALQRVADLAEKTTGIAGSSIFDTLLERERLGSTGVGNGVAIPHGRLEGLDRLVGVFVRLESPIDFEAIDDQPVDLIFGLLAPKDVGTDHLKALARVSRLLRDQTVCEKLRGADTAQAAFALLAHQQANAA